MRPFAKLALFGSLCAFLPHRTAAQDDPNFKAGFAPYTFYLGGDIDSIGPSNGSLTVKIPLLSYPQRGGKLRLNLSMIYENRGYVGKTICVGPSPQVCQISYSSNGNGFRIVDEDGIALTTSGESIVFLNEFTNSFNLVDPDGSNHALDDASSTPLSVFMTVDGSGYRFDNKTSTATSPDGVKTNFANSGTTCDQRTLASWGVEVAPCEPSSRQDPNRNQISFSTTAGWTDTVGRAIPLPVATTDFSGCSGSQPVTSALLWSVPGANGSTYTLKFCYIVVPLVIGTGQGSFSLTASSCRA